jgi:ABC-type Fe3+-siderophore transport system permease subunit
MKKIGIILIIISAVLLLAGDFIGELWPISKEIFESSIIAFIGLIGIIYLAEGIKSEKQTR